MRTGWRAAALLLSGVCALALSTPARAATDEQPIRIQYDAHVGCPDALQFFWHVRARTARLRLAEPNELATAVSVSIKDDGGNSVGTLELPPVGGQAFTRRVEAGTCEDVVVALSLVLALAFDPDASTVLPPLPAMPPPPAITQPMPIVVRETVTIEPSARAGAGVGARFMSGIEPGLRPVIAPFIEYGSLADALFRPSVSVTLLLSPSHDTSSKLNGTAYSASLTFLGGQLAGCPLYLRLLGNRLELSPCLAFDLGEILGSGGSGVSPAKTGSAVWASIEALGNIRWNAVGPLFVEAVGGGGIPLSRSKFAVGEQPSQLVLHHIPVGFGEFGLDIGVHFP